MPRTVSSTSSTPPRLASLSQFEKVRFAAFTRVAVATLAVAALMIRAELLMAATSWSMDFGIHQVHDQLLFAFLWITLIIPVALMLYHPTDRVNAILAPVSFAVPWTVLAFLVGSSIIMLGAVFGALGLVLVRTRHR